MKMTISARQMTLKDSLREMAETKLKKYDKFFADEADAQVTFSARHGEETVEVTIVSNGTIFRTEASADTFRSAFDRAIEGLDRQIRKHKTKLEKRMRSGAYEAIGEDAPAEEEAPAIRVKTYPFKPMSPEEAILQMELLGHSFFVFIDQETEKTCVVYQRQGGGYGMICPQ